MLCSWRISEWCTVIIVLRVLYEYHSDDCLRRYRQCLVIAKHNLTVPNHFRQRACDVCPQLVHNAKQTYPQHAETHLPASPFSKLLAGEKDSKTSMSCLLRRASTSLMSVSWYISAAELRQEDVQCSWCAGCNPCAWMSATWATVAEQKGGKERNGKERKGKERTGKERKGQERKGKERKKDKKRQHKKRLRFLASI